MVSALAALVGISVAQVKKPVIEFNSSNISVLPDNPRPNAKVTFVIALYNSGQADAERLQILTTVDRQPLGSTLSTVNARSRMTVRGLPQWDAVAGRHTVDITIIGDGIRKSASKTFLVSGTPLDIHGSGGSGGGQNGVQVGALTFGQDDLIADPSSPTAGENVKFGLKIMNNSYDTVRDVTVELYVGTKLIGRQSIASIRGGRTIRANSFPEWKSEKGYHNVRFLVSYAGFRGEAKDNFSVSASKDPPTGSLRDLSFGSRDITLSTSNPRNGDWVRFGINLTNKGSLEVKSTVVELFVSDKSMGKQEIKKIDAGKSFHASSFTLWKAVTGRKPIRFVVTQGEDRREIRSTISVAK